MVTYSEYRATLSSYLDARMRAIAPNLTELVGYLVGARLIAHTGSLMSLAKSAGSTIQILGAEKALFRALKTKHSTPKYGLIYHSSLVGQASGKNKGKIARQLAAKTALGVRVDALEDYGGREADEDERAALGAAARAKLENNLRRLEGKPLSKAVAIAPNGAPSDGPAKWDVKEARKYNIDADGMAGNDAAAAETETETAKSQDKADTKSKKKEKKEKKRAPSPEQNGDGQGAADEEMADAQNGSAGKVHLSRTVSAVPVDCDDLPKSRRKRRRRSSSPDDSRMKEPHRWRALASPPILTAKRAERHAQGQSFQAPEHSGKPQQERHANQPLGPPAAPPPTSQAASRADSQRQSTSGLLSSPEFPWSSSSASLTAATSI